LEGSEKLFKFKSKKLLYQSGSVFGEKEERQRFYRRLKLTVPAAEI